MKAYLVGGAVRDKLLKLSVLEKDWVVVGETKETMLAKGFIQVGKDFPVFLHPVTKEEYALARIEKKVGRGYKGFSFEANKSISLEEDLSRRDLTINAMAEDEKGNLIDPYGGQNDIICRVLKHVSQSFNEDPVRILRLARFKARYHYLGFTVAPETSQLMIEMVKSGEVDYLQAERVWKEWQKSLTEQNPECFIEVLRDCGALKVILPELDALFGIPNPPKHHPEIDSGVHSLMVLKVASQLSSCPVIRFAALMHDLGKSQTPLEKWPSHPSHEELGEGVIYKIAKRLKIPKTYSDLAILASKYHILIHRILELRANTIVNVLEQLDVFRRGERFSQLLTVCKSDALGRKDQESNPYPQQALWLEVVSKLQKIRVKDIIDSGYEGSKIKLELHRRRVLCVKSLLKQWKLHEK